MPHYLNKYDQEVYAVDPQYQPSNEDSIHQVLQQAGPTHVYQSNGFKNNGRNSTTITTEVTHYPEECTTTRTNFNRYAINEDHNPIRVVRPLTAASAVQNVRVRYLEPPMLPQPNPIIIKERALTPPPQAPPIVVRQVQKAPPTPPPLVIRERPPTEPYREPTRVIEKLIPPPAPAPRQVIVERIPAPHKPREIIYEKWLPYKKQPERPVIVQRAQAHPRPNTPKNIIVDYQYPETKIERRVHDEGVLQANPRTHGTHRPHGVEIKEVDQIRDLPIDGRYRTSHTSYLQQRPKSAHGSVAFRNTPAPFAPTMRAQTPVAVGGGPNVYRGPWRTTYNSAYQNKGYGYY